MPENHLFFHAPRSHNTIGRICSRKFMHIYACRSRAVHDGHFDTTIKFGKEKISRSQFIARAQDLCLRSIRNILDEEKKQVPDRGSLILSGEVEEVNN